MLTRFTSAFPPDWQVRIDLCHRASKVFQVTHDVTLKGPLLPEVVCLWSKTSSAVHLSQLKIL